MSGYPSYKPFDEDDTPDDFILPPGNPERGAKIFKKKCAQCHSIRPDGLTNTGRTLLGPNLYGVYGRTAGVNPRSSLLHSSSGMTTSGILWTDLNLMRYIKNPRAFTDSPIYMNFKGIDDWQERIDLIWYIKSAGHKNWITATSDVAESNSDVTHR